MAGREHKEKNSADHEAGESSDVAGGVVTETKIRIRRPSLYRVLLLNDDFTPMDFVVLILEKFFHKTPPEATQIMLNVHQKGVGICGVYPYEIAETKVALVTEFSRENEHPLQCTMERAT